MTKQHTLSQREWQLVQLMREGRHIRIVELASGGYAGVLENAQGHVWGGTIRLHVIRNLEWLNYIKREGNIYRINT